MTRLGCVQVIQAMMLPGAKEIPVNLCFFNPLQSTNHVPLTSAIGPSSYYLHCHRSHSLIAHLSGINGSGYHIGTQQFMPCLKAMFAKQRACSKPDDDAGVVNCQCH